MNNEVVHSPGLGEKAGVVLFSQWAQFCELREKALRNPDIDAVHDLRVASRRLRASAGLFAPLISGKRARRITRELQGITRELGRLRNLDEALAYFGACTVSLPVLGGKLAAARGHELKRVLEELGGFPRQKLDRQIRKGVAELSLVDAADSKLAEYLEATALRRFRDVHDLLLPATAPDEVATRHALRIAIKKWRYLLETAGLVCRHDYSHALELLKEYQTLLGTLNDIVEFTALCAGYNLPDGEQNAARDALVRDEAESLAAFLRLAAEHPPHYTFDI